MGQRPALTMLDIAIVGGGLAGLSLAQRLQEAGRSIAVFESADRFGGRIFSCPPRRGDDRPTTASSETFQYDLGPGWVWPDMQPRMAGFIAQYAIEIYSQWYYGDSLYHADRLAAPQRYVDHSSYAAARRIKGGTYRLIEVLLEQLSAETLFLNHHLVEVIDQRDHVELCFRQGSSEVCVRARQVVLTLPPRLLAESIVFRPQLDERLSELMRGTSTWMAGHAKAVVRYPSAFWRDQGFSGSALCAYQGAALSEIFDACSVDEAHAVLSGFMLLPPQLRQDYRDDLNALILEQLVRLFGKQAAEAEEILIKDWFAESRTATQADEIPPAGHPQYGHTWLQLDHWNDKLYFGGTESAIQFGGYLEGALEAAERVAKNLLM